MRRRRNAWSRLHQFLRRAEWLILPSATAIFFFGFWMQWSVAGGEAVPKGHVIRMIAAFGALCFAASYSAKRWRNQAYLFYGFVLFLLVFVLLTGRATNNAKRWIDLWGGFKIQPSELAKMALILFLSRWFADHPRPRKLKELFAPAIYCAVPGFLILAEPDLGTALTIAPLFLGMAWLAGLPWKQWRWLVILPALVAPFAFFHLQDYQRERMDTWWRQDALTLEEKSDAGYHLWHAKLAVGSGGVYGFGWARGPENRLDRLPERHNDFIFPVIAEEKGFLGAAFFLCLYASLPWILLVRASRHRDPFTRLVISGVGIHFAVHLVMNVGVSTGLWPTTGLPLPMVSFGGTSMAVSGLILGLVLAVSARPGPVFSARAFED